MNTTGGVVARYPDRNDRRYDEKVRDLAERASRGDRSADRALRIMGDVDPGLLPPAVRVEV